MKRVLLFIICTFLFAGVNATAQDTKNADPQYFEIDEHPSFQGGGPNNFATVVLKSPKWKPGIKDGKPVKVTYTMPVALYFRN